MYTLHKVCLYSQVTESVFIRTRYIKCVYMHTLHKVCLYAQVT